MFELIRSREFQIGVVTGVGGVAVAYGLLVGVGTLLRPWLMARVSSIPLSLGQLLGMHLRKVAPLRVVEAYLIAQSRGEKPDVRTLEATYLAFGNEIRTGHDLDRLAQKHAGKSQTNPSGAA